jgi:hypothetical protein
LTVKAASSGGGGGSSPSNTDPVSPGGSSGPSGTSTPTPTDTPTPSSSPDGMGNYGVSIDGQQFYGSGSCTVDDIRPSVSGLGGAYVQWIKDGFTQTSCPLSAKTSSAELGVWSPNVAHKVVGNELFTVTVSTSGNYTSSAPTEPTPTASASASPTQVVTQAATKTSTQAATQGATQGGTSRVS